MKIFTGKVKHTKMAKTATVAVERVVAHPIYKKRYKKIKKYHVHDELGVKVGQEVKFTASRPYSKLKRWKVIEIVNKSRVGSKGSTSRKSKLNKTGRPDSSKGKKGMVRK